MNNRKLILTEDQEGAIKRFCITFTSGKFADDIPTMPNGDHVIFLPPTAENAWAAVWSMEFDGVIIDCLHGPMDEDLMRTVADRLYTRTWMFRNGKPEDEWLR
jgi:hypothetical protein